MVLAACATKTSSENLHHSAPRLFPGKVGIGPGGLRRGFLLFPEGSQSENSLNKSGYSLFSSSLPSLKQKSEDKNCGWPCNMGVHSWLCRPRSALSRQGYQFVAPMSGLEARAQRLRAASFWGAARINTLTTRPLGRGDDARVMDYLSWAPAFGL